MLFIGIVLCILALDLGIKEAIEEMDTASFPKTLEKTEGRIILHKNHNEGFALGIYRSHPKVVKMLPVVVTSAVAGIFVWLHVQKGNIVEKLAVAMVLGGALSNLYDRLTRGYVVDYFSIQWKKIKSVVFNLGDIFIFSGAVLLLVVEVIRNFKEN